MIERIVVAGGGTGGHLFPGMAVVDELRRRLSGIEVLFVGTRRGIEARVLPDRGERVAFVPVAPLKGMGLAKTARSLATLPVALARATAVLTDFRPDVVVGVGGYASGPVVAAAAALRIPTAVLEQNAFVGLTNRLLARTVGRAYLSFDETARCFGAERARVVGNPVRRTFVETARRAASDPAGFEARATSVLVLGGSGGAQVLNEQVPKALAQAKLDADVRVIHQTGSGKESSVADSYDKCGLHAMVVPFIDDMASAVASAKLVIARAGATTVAELCAIGRPAILVPFPYAADDHQTKNARALERAGGAVCLPQSLLSTERLSEEVRTLLSDGPKRRAMAAAARTLGHPDAAASIVDDLLSWVGDESPVAGTPAQRPTTIADPSEHGERRNDRSERRHYVAHRVIPSTGRASMASRPARRPLILSYAE